LLSSVVSALAGWVANVAKSTGSDPFLPNPDPGRLQGAHDFVQLPVGVILEADVVGQLVLGEARERPVLGVGAQDLAAVAGQVALPRLHESR
jgi:hypothetical protein